LAAEQGASEFLDQSFREAESACGMAEYQGLHWRAWHRHMALLMIATLFLAKERIAHRDRAELLSRRDLAEIMRPRLPATILTAEDLAASTVDRHRRRRQAWVSAYGTRKPPRSPDRVAGRSQEVALATKRQSLWACIPNVTTGALSVHKNTKSLRRMFGNEHSIVVAEAFLVRHFSRHHPSVTECSQGATAADRIHGIRPHARNMYVQLIVRSIVGRVDKERHLALRLNPRRRYLPGEFPNAVRTRLVFDAGHLRSGYRQTVNEAVGRRRRSASAHLVVSYGHKVCVFIPNLSRSAAARLLGAALILPGRLAQAGRRASGPHPRISNAVRDHRQ